MIDCIVVGGGHNGLVAATYLARAGLAVRLFEASDELGGATSSQQVFKGVGARLSRYSYLVSLLPDRIVKELGLNFETITRAISSFTPYRDLDGEDRGLLISNDWEEARTSFLRAGLGDEAEKWRTFYDDIAAVAPTIADTFLEPLPTRSEIEAQVGPEISRLLFSDPIGSTLRSRFSDDLIQGIVLTDALIGTFTDAEDPSLLANRCFLYHLVGNGDGQWRVPRGGMGALVTELRRVALNAGVTIETGKRVERIDSGKVWVDGHELTTRFIVAACSPQELSRLRGRNERPPLRPGSQLKVNMVLRQLPRLKSGVDPRLAFAGTFHIDESYQQLQTAYREALDGKLPEVIPAEIYCHTLTDRTILEPELDREGFQTLTLFAIHTPYQLFLKDNKGVKALALQKLLRQLNAYLIDPIEECLAVDGDGKPAIEIKSPLDLEAEIGLPLGNIFHGDLTFPWREESEEIRWGSETDDPTIFLAGSGARRGGGVSGIAGHNAASAIIEIA